MNTTIEEQIKILQEATTMALKSKESAIKYLRDAGIIKKESSPATSKPSKHATAK